MNCKYCKEPMQDFTDSFVMCYNDDCPHMKLDSIERQGAKTRRYCIQK